MKMALKMCAVHLPLLTKPKPWYLSCEHNTFPQHNCTFHWLILYRTTTICYLSTKRGGAIWYRAMTMAVFGMEYLLTTYCVVYYLYTMEACFHHRIIKKKKKTFHCILYLNLFLHVILKLSQNDDFLFPRTVRDIYVSAVSLVLSSNMLSVNSKLSYHNKRKKNGKNKYKKIKRELQDINSEF